MRAALSSLLVLLAPAVVRAEGGPLRLPDAEARGITVSCWTWGGEWARPEMRELMATLSEVGANWLAIHPYAHVSRETGEVRWRPDAPLDHVVKPIRWARELGLRIMIKPHLSYWGEFAWRGEIGWGADAERWARFRDSYRAWIAHLARASGREGADLFVVGTELRQTEAMSDWWAALIHEVRAGYPGPLTYAANWDDYERVPFWSRLDYVGVQAYFPLSSSPDPGEQELRGAWAGHARRLAEFSRGVGRPVLLAEVGYTSSPWAAERPWESPRGSGPTAVQSRALRAALETARATPEIHGAFIWKWFPTTRSLGPGDFTVQTPEFKSLIREAWAPAPPPPAARALPPAARGP
jgi:hypothetical protein